MKSILKNTPPITPDLSVASTPCPSGRTSPSSDGGSSSGASAAPRIQKTVSFCEEEDLEEVFFADEWDRTPSSVTPKLSYQDILELKQLRVHLPYHQPVHSYSHPPAPPTKPPFPISRFAAGPSHTPDRWKNRSQPRPEVDPEILPYLEAVPIRLLPLLPQSPVSETPPPSPPLQQPTPPEPHAVPPPPPLDPPETVKVPSEPTPQPSTPSPLPSPPTRFPPRRTPSFSFVPLLPVEDPPPTPPTPVVSHTPSLPKRTFNMIFVPVLASPSDVPVTPASDSHPAAPAPGSPVGLKHQLAQDIEALPSPVSPITDSPPSSSVPLSIPTTPALTDRDTDLDTDTDTTETDTETDAESDAPSVATVETSSSSFPSPHLEDAVFQGDNDMDRKNSGYVVEDGYFRGVEVAEPSQDQDNSCCPALPLRSGPLSKMTAAVSGPGCTPPLSILYPSPQSPASRARSPLTRNSDSEEPTPALGAQRLYDAVPVSPSTTLPLPLPLHDAKVAGRPTLQALPEVLKKKLTLEALPSPALVPPSPFLLSPPNPQPSKIAFGMHSRVQELSLAGIPDIPTPGSECDGVEFTMSKIRALPDIPTPTEDSPMLTVENVRQTWDERGAEEMYGASLQPSFSRRRTE